MRILYERNCILFWNHLLPSVIFLHCSKEQKIYINLIGFSSYAFVFLYCPFCQLISWKNEWINTFMALANQSGFWSHSRQAFICSSSLHHLIIVGKSLFIFPSSGIGFCQGSFFLWVCFWQFGIRGWHFLCLGHARVNV